MMQLSIVIPTYNESGNVRPLSEAIAKAFSGIGYEIVFVDDGSPDGTSGAIRSLPGYGKTIKLIERTGKLGLASAVAEGAKAAVGDRVLVMDGDLSHPPEIAREMFDSRNDADLVVASRNISGGGKSKEWSASRDMISKSAEALCRPIVGNRTTDPLSGFFLAKKDIFEKTRIRVKGYKILLNLVHDNPKTTIKDIPYVFKARFSGKTKLDLTEIINYLFDLARLACG